MYIPVEMRKSDLVTALAHMDREELLDLIKEVDEKIGEWDFTLSLIGYANHMAEVYEKENN